MKEELTMHDKILSGVLHVHSSYPEKADATFATQLLELVASWVLLAGRAAILFQHH